MPSLLPFTFIPLAIILKTNLEKYKESIDETNKSKDNLLDEHGRVKHPGYATSLVLDYDRSQVKAKKSRIGRDISFGNDRYGVALTIADNSYMGLIGATFFRFCSQEEI